MLRFLHTDLKKKLLSLKPLDADTPPLSSRLCDLSVKYIQMIELNNLFMPLLDPGFNSHRPPFVTHKGSIPTHMLSLALLLIMSGEH